MSERPRQTNCQQEPHYPGLHTAVLSIRYPDLTVHTPSKRCPIHEPHAIADCGDFQALPVAGKEDA